MIRAFKNGKIAVAKSGAMEQRPFKNNGRNSKSHTSRCNQNIYTDMKKVLLILVAVIGFGFCVNAEGLCVKTKVSHEAKNNGETMEVTVKVTVQNQSGQFEVCVSPTGKYRGLFSGSDNCKSAYNQTEVTFKFTCNTDAWPGEYCKSYDFTYKVNGQKVDVCP
jgi:uncharacterized lipoprotein YajG